MTLQRLKWLTLLAPLAFLAALEVAQQLIAPAFFRAWPGYLLLAGVALLATLAFNEAIFGVLDRMQARQARQNRELLALHQAGLDIAEELDLETVLQRVVGRATALVGARYGALSLPREGGGIAAFIAAGIKPEHGGRRWRSRTRAYIAGRATWRSARSGRASRARGMTAWPRSSATSTPRLRRPRSCCAPVRPSAPVRSSPSSARPRARPTPTCVRTS